MQVPQQPAGGDPVQAQIDLCRSRQVELAAKRAEAAAMGTVLGIAIADVNAKAAQLGLKLFDLGNLVTQQAVDLELLDVLYRQQS
jgi:hypothetical protein